MKTLLLMLFLAAPQDHVHEGEQLGKVHFENSCLPSVAPKFDRAVALLHSFSFPAAIEGFNDVLKDDPNCGIAHWGIALSQWGNPFATNVRAQNVLDQALAEVQKGIPLAKTPRERDFLNAVGELYKDGATANQRTRLVNYERALEQLSTRYANDSEAAIFYAAALDATALPTDKTFANQLKAAVILDREFAKQPEHPGITHYLIHSYDVPPLAARGLEAARRYASLAPSAPHALHMPSHIFTRVGEWESSIETNLKSADTARKSNAPNDALHASDYLAYAYLQTGRDQAVKKLIEEIAPLGTGNTFAVAAIPARYVIERQAWSEAKDLVVRPAAATPYTDAMTRFVRALGFARTGNAASAKAEVAELQKLRDTLMGMNDAYWTEQVEIQLLAATAWISRTEGNSIEALSLLRTAANREDATEKAPVTPGPLKPAREQLGELLLDVQQPAVALREFEQTLQKEPNRFRAVYGAARAAQLSGDNAKSRQYFGQLLEISKQADSERPELIEARRLLNR